MNHLPLKKAITLSLAAHALVAAAFYVRRTSVVLAPGATQITLRERAVATSPPRAPKLVRQRIAKTNITKDLPRVSSAAVTPASTETSHEVGVAQRALLEGAYLDLLREKIKTLQHYPPLALARRQSGEVKVGLTVLENGELTDIHLVRESGFAKLNQAALEAVFAVHHFTPLPLDLHRRQLALVVPIVFRLEN